MRPSRTICLGKGYFFQTFFISIWKNNVEKFNNEISDANRKICSRFSDTVSCKAILGPMIITEIIRQCGSE